MSRVVTLWKQRNRPGFAILIARAHVVLVPTLLSSSLPLRAYQCRVMHYAARTLAERSFQGLEQQLGETPVVRAVQGRRGIAIGYDEEPQT